MIENHVEDPFLIGKNYNFYSGRKSNLKEKVQAESDSMKRDASQNVDLRV
jgi:hypothetical protein